MGFLAQLRLKTTQILKDQGFRRYASNTSWMFGEQILRIIAGVLVGIWVARYLGPQKFGGFSYALAFVAIFSGIAKLGLDAVVVRNLVNNPANRDLYLGTAFWLKLIAAILTLLFIVLSAIYSLNDSTTNLYILIIASGLIFQSFEVVDFYFQSKVLSKFVSISKITQLFLSSLLKIYFVFTGADLFWFVLVSLLDQITLAISLGFAYKSQKCGGFYRYFDIEVAKALLGDSWALWVSSFFTLFLLNINRILLNSILGAQAVGIFSAAVNLATAFTFITIVVTNSLSPAIISAKNRSAALYNERLFNLFRLLLVLSIGLSVVIFFLADYLIQILYGTNYSEAAAVLKVYVWSIVFVFLGNGSWQWYINENMLHLSVVRLFVGAVSAYVLGYLFIYRYGIVGAAISTIISNLIAFYVGNLFLKKTRPLFIIQSNAFFNIFNFKSYFNWFNGGIYG